MFDIFVLRKPSDTPIWIADAEGMRAAVKWLKKPKYKKRVGDFILVKQRGQSSSETSAYAYVIDAAKVKTYSGNLNKTPNDDYDWEERYNDCDWAMILGTIHHGVRRIDDGLAKKVLMPLMASLLMLVAPDFASLKMKKYADSAKKKKLAAPPSFNLILTYRMVGEMKDLDFEFDDDGLTYGKTRRILFTAAELLGSEYVTAAMKTMLPFEDFLEWVES